MLKGYMWRSKKEIASKILFWNQAWEKIGVGR